MPELVAIKTLHFECVIWAKTIDASQQRYVQTMDVRKKPVKNSLICFHPAVEIQPSNELLKTYLCDDTLFFENKLYDIEFVFDDSLKNAFTHKIPKVLHRLRSIEEAFHYSPRSHSIRASINTANDIGWFRIELQYEFNHKEYTQAIAFEVLPTKIDMSSDVDHMNTVIDQHYPLWRFALAEKTQQQFSAVKKPHPQFLLLWLAQFESLRKEFEKGLKHIVNAPHSRLINESTALKAEKLKGKLSPKLEMSVKQAQSESLSNKRFIVQKKRLSVDTPENRFIKAVIKISIDKLARVVLIAKQNQKAPDVQRLSDSFFQTLNSWQSSIRKFQRHALFKEVGEFSGLSKESLVLQQKMGYAKVYRVWQELKLYLELLGDDSSLSLRNVAELYEVWCFLEFRRILLSLGFKEVFNQKALLRKNGLEVSMNDGIAGAFCFTREDGIKLTLAHEREFKKDGNPVKTWTTTQKPDILLEAVFADGSGSNTKVIWLFDAKYRIDKDEEQDLVPDDAINQLHRYRDALIHHYQPISKLSEKTRPVFGAYALYPGFYDQTTRENPYQRAIEEVGIGAFSLLPAVDHSGSHWLKLFLQQKLGLLKKNYSLAESDQYFVEESIRIPYKGTSVSHYSDLTIAVSGMVSGRTKQYRENLENGQASFYHMQLFASQRQNIEQHVIKEARYLAIAVTVSKSQQEINYLYPIIVVEQKKRAELTIEQTGTNKIKEPDKVFWLFTLGAALKLKSPLIKTSVRRFEVKLTSAAALSDVENWSDLPQRYQFL
ncbi:MAG: DUF2357 domain-containing protein [Gammaproteobacteria bacterium]|nr:DUF2357 domain-containing protein [Gammaproteobacteria bacterium]